MTPENSPTELVTYEGDKTNVSGKEIFLVINPVAAGGRVKTLWEEQIKPLMDNYDLEYDFEFTSPSYQAIDIARTKVNEGYKIICAVGGDGTANEVLNGILTAEERGVFSAIPVGTGNDTPTVFGIPEEDVEAAVQCLVQGQNKNFDVGYCEKADRYFAGIASMGFDAEVADRTEKGSKRTKRFLGNRSYQLALGTSLAKFKPYNLVIHVDRDQVIEGRKMLVAIGNGKRYGGGMHVCPEAEVTDGKFAVTAVQKMSRITLVRFFSTVYHGDHLTHESVETFEGSTIHVDSPQKKCLYQADGEVLGYLPETFTTKPNHLTVRVPNPWISYSDIWKKTLWEKEGYSDPFTGNKLLLAKLAYFNPISNFKRGLDWNQDAKSEITEELTIGDKIQAEEKPEETSYLNVKEKRFSKRVSFFLFRTFFQTLSVSIAFTAPITLPWLFDIAFPNLMGLIPPEVHEFINHLITSIQSLFKPFAWLEPIIRFFMDLGAIFNPFLIFSLLLIFFKEIGALAEEDFQDPFSSTNGTPTSTGYFLQSIRKKFTVDFSSAMFILLIVSSCVSFFLVVRRARGIIFEVMTTKEEIKHLEKVRKIFLKYCKEGTYSDINYSKNRFSESRRTKVFANMVKFGPLVSAIIPAILAILYILL